MKENNKVSHPKKGNNNDVSNESILKHRSVGYLRDRYPEKRNIINRGGNMNEYVHIGKLRYAVLMSYRAVEILIGKVIRRTVKMNNDAHAIYKSFKNAKVDVIHTFNTVCDTDIPWVSTFETMIPRTNILCGREWETGGVDADKVTKRGFRLLANDSCKALIALSEANKNIQLRIMETLDIKNKEKIAKKIVVIHPPQKVLITKEEVEEKFKRIDECVEFIFIGGLFFRKGGAQILDAMEKMVSSGMKLHLTVVSSLADDGFTKITRSEKERYEKMIAESDWITHFPSLPNEKVLELSKKAHVGLLPSMADTYGYSVLEMMASGCTVITTDIRAMPEINNDECGYMIRVPKHPSTEAKYDTEKDLEILKNTVYEQLCEYFSQIRDDTSSVKMKAEASVEKIKRDHDPEKYARLLDEIYGT